ncbi:DUF2927 domain-containing protein [Labrenzia sp. R4_2]|uniref:DUF2927 domain-containing protein n=1 Tax=Labrenzia sp. R4_2 TaxID=2821107 RepID=UPI001ADB4CDF|nr:DUF2927 domain-containing protein [Labrenzia sp. R4_2]
MKSIAANMMRKILIFMAMLALSASMPARASSEAFTTEDIMFGFEQTVFGLEHRSWGWRPYLVKKFTTPVRFYIHNLARRDRTATVRRFVKEIDRRVSGLSATVVRRPADANFEIYVVDRNQYKPVVRTDIYKNPKAKVPGRCLVRVISGRNGIKRSAAVIVSDEGEFLFQRCLVEEVLQGLGPMNDNHKLVHSVFNDSSRHNRFTVFDQIILNMLYDPRIKPGMSVKQTQDILLQIARDARRRVR